jgi:membrane-associated phospholipid phosphatase
LSTAPNLPPVNDTANIALWNVDTRAYVIDQALMAPLLFAPQPNGLSVWHTQIAWANNQPTMSATLLAGMTRPSSKVFSAQLELVERYAAIRADRAHEIVSQMALPLGFLGLINWLSMSKTPKTLELLMAAVRMTVRTHMQFKQALSCPRPIEYSPQVQPIIDTPQHGALPAGHAAEAFVMAVVLGELLAGASRPPFKTEHARWREQLFRLASRISINRVVAGVHFPIDLTAGAMIGLTLGRYLVARASKGTAATYEAWSFDGAALPANYSTDFDGTVLSAAIMQGSATVPAGLVKGSSGNPCGSAGNALSWLWAEAAKEWK